MISEVSFGSHWPWIVFTLLTGRYLTKLILSSFRRSQNILRLDWTWPGDAFWFCNSEACGRVNALEEIDVGAQAQPFPCSWAQTGLHEKKKPVKRKVWGRRKCKGDWELLMWYNISIIVGNSLYLEALQQDNVITRYFSVTRFYCLTNAVLEVWYI